MILDIGWFGSGAGLVMCGWLVGMICGSLFQTLRRV